MTNHGVLERPKTRAKIIAWLLEGKGPSEIAGLVSTPAKPVSRQAICRFRNRHTDLIAPVVAEVERQISDAAIASIVNRVLDADADYRLLGQVIDARAADTRYDEPGYKTGLMVHQLKQVGSGRDATLVDEYKVDTSLVAERRALRREVSEVLGQLPQAAPNTFIDNRTQILVREYGVDLKRIG